MSIVVGVHVLVCFLLIIVVLVQAGKGSSMGSLIGGSSQSIVDGGSASTFLTKATTMAAIIFMITSLSMGYLQSKKNNSIMDLKVESSTVSKQNINANLNEENILDNNIQKNKTFDLMKEEKSFLNEIKNNYNNTDNVFENKIK